MAYNVISLIGTLIHCINGIKIGNNYTGNCNNYYNTTIGVYFTFEETLKTDDYKEVI